MPEQHEEPGPSENPTEATMAWLNERGYFIVLFHVSQNPKPGEYRTMTCGTAVYLIDECPKEELAELVARFPWSWAASIGETYLAFRARAD